MLTALARKGFGRTADYLAWLGQQPLVGQAYSHRALKLGQALHRPALPDEQIWKVAA